MRGRVVVFLLLIFTLSFGYVVQRSEGSVATSKVHQRCSNEERDALHDFKQSLFDPQLVLSTWEIGEDCCTWQGVSCSNTTNHVIKLDLSEEDSLHATSLVLSLFLLQHLQYLSLSGISFNQASIPHSIGSLTELRYLDLSGSEFAGVIPPQLGNLTNLSFLDLSGNYLVAYNLAWMSCLSSLYFIDMSNVNLTSATNWLHEIKVLPSLSSLYLSFCSLHTLPTSLPYSNFSSTIHTVDLSFNYLSGSIPKWVGNMRNLRNLNLGINKLNGSIPHSLGQLKNLVSLDLHSNRLYGSLSDINFANLSQLNSLYLSDNDLDFNMISFNWIPPFQISFLSISSCHVGPQFPIWLQNQKFLSYLDLSNCGLSDIIPSWFWNISSQINYLNISQNELGGKLPTSINIEFAATIDLKSNQLEGRLPLLLNFVRYVSFSNNKFSSGIESYLNANTSFLAALDLSQNLLSSKIPDSICQMPSIILLDLSHNNLFGEIPKCPGNISIYTTLKFVSLAYNNLWGSIPQWIGNLSVLLSLHLNNNDLQGEIPFLRNCSKLLTVDLGQNHLIGNIPSWIGDRLLSLKILRLRSNKFYGSIPSELSKLKELHILDIADNFLSGPIPKSIKLLNSMTIQNKSHEPLIPNEDFVSTYRRGSVFLEDYLNYFSISWPDALMINIKGKDREFTYILSLVKIIDFSCNNLSGEVPVELMSLLGLISLNLSRNEFTGQIPINIGDMQNLESLDLSRNHFSGQIPESIVKLSKLNYLNLSYNQLSGRIPSATQLDTFKESSYYGNSKLCGMPLLKTCKDDEHNIHKGGSNSNDDDDDDNFGLFLGMGLGFAVGLWSVLGILLFKKSWAIAYFKWYDNMTNNIYVYIAVKINRHFYR